MVSCEKHKRFNPNCKDCLEAKEKAKLETAEENIEKEESVFEAEIEKEEIESLSNEEEPKISGNIIPLIPNGMHIISGVAPYVFILPSEVGFCSVIEVVDPELTEKVKRGEIPQKGRLEGHTKITVKPIKVGFHRTTIQPREYKVLDRILTVWEIPKRDVAVPIFQNINIPSGSIGYLQVNEKFKEIGVVTPGDEILGKYEGKMKRSFYFPTGGLIGANVAWYYLTIEKKR